MNKRMVIDRIYSDYFHKSRMDEYRELLHTLLNAGYTFISIWSLWQRAQAPGGLGALDKYIVLRHDIDSDIATARQMWEIEKEFGIQSSYFFRLSTIDERLMQDIHSSGSDAGYHYEEIAAYSNDHGLRNSEEISMHLKEIQVLFQSNIAQLRIRTGLPIPLAASHGDFLNRKLGVRNVNLLRDQSFRASAGVALEAYDEEYRRLVDKFYSDGAYPVYWKPEHPFTSMESDRKKIQLLIHPGNWQSTAYLHTYHNINRAYRELKYHVVCLNNAVTQHVKSVFTPR